MISLLVKADSRGNSEHGWLSSRHTFSFSSYFNPERTEFGTLRVINDDVVQPGAGFATHSHNNMEIISIPLYGELKHKDTIGNQHIIKNGEVQIMSAGTGIAHSEYNNSNTDIVSFLQIWVRPKQKDITPIYAQAKFPLDQCINQFQLIISPDGRDGSLKINQDAFFSLVKLTKDTKLKYTLYNPGNYLYLYILLIT
jgi:redox-sensitive bicupin YhaK (pirin superfamily)